MDINKIRAEIIQGIHAFASLFEMKSFSECDKIQEDILKNISRIEKQAKEEGRKEGMSTAYWKGKEAGLVDGKEGERERIVKMIKNIMNDGITDRNNNLRSNLEWILKAINNLNQE